MYTNFVHTWAILKNILPILSHPKSTIWCNTRSLSINGFHAITWWSVFIVTWKCVFIYILPFCWTFVLGILKVNILTASIKKQKKYTVIWTLIMIQYWMQTIKCPSLFMWNVHVLNSCYWTLGYKQQPFPRCNS
jgi:hypothetical protein